MNLIIRLLVHCEVFDPFENENTDKLLAYFLSTFIAILAKGQKNRPFWKGIGIQNFATTSSYSFNRIGIIPYP